MAFTDAEKVLIRKYTGYAMKGGIPVQNFGWRFFQWYGTLEFFMINLSIDEETEIRTNFMPKLANLETDSYTARDNLDTKQAAVWYWNTNEIRDRQRLYNYWRLLLCDFMGIPPGPQFGAGTPVGFTV
jgi:hypothetical protein